MPRNSSYTVFLRSAIPLLMLVSSVGRLDGQQMTTKRTLRIDAAAEGLTEIGSLVVGRDGVIMITQPQDFRVLVFDRAGRRVASIGRKGGGPGSSKPSAGWADSEMVSGWRIRYSGDSRSSGRIWESHESSPIRFLPCRRTGLVGGRRRCQWRFGPMGP